MISPTVLERAKAIRLLALDVDGVLTDGVLHYDASGAEQKAFSVRDGLGIKLLQRAGVTIAIISGRRSQPVMTRAAELGIEHVIVGRDDKLAALQELCIHLNLRLDEAAYMGDDLPDLAAVHAAGLGLTVADAAEPVYAAADWRSDACGGRGAVREACEMLLQARDQWAETLASYR